MDYKLNKTLAIVLLAFVVGLLIFGVISAEVQELGTAIQGQCIQLIQTCDNCSYVNISQITHISTSKNLLNNQVQMTKIGTRYNYTFCNTYEDGEYVYNTFGDLDGVITSENPTFLISPSGTSGAENIAFFIFIILLLYLVLLVSFFGKNIPLTILSGGAVVFLGVYLINNGIIIFRDDLTLYLGYFTIAMGAILGLWAVVEWLEEIM